MRFLNLQTLPVAALRLVPGLPFLRHHAQLVPPDGLALRLAQLLESRQRLRVPLPRRAQLPAQQRQRPQLAERNTSTTMVFILSGYFQTDLAMILCFIELPDSLQIIS